METVLIILGALIVAGFVLAVAIPFIIVAAVAMFISYATGLSFWLVFIPLCVIAFFFFMSSF